MLGSGANHGWQSFLSSFGYISEGLLFSVLFFYFLPLLDLRGVACELLDFDAPSSEKPPWSESRLEGSSSWPMIFECSPTGVEGSLLGSEARRGISSEMTTGVSVTGCWGISPGSMGSANVGPELFLTSADVPSTAKG